MIDRQQVIDLTNEWLADKEYFLVDVVISKDDKITVEIDHAEGVWIEDCADLSRFIESKINREDEDYELEVGSAGLGYPFKVRRQWEIHLEKPVETQLKDGHKYRGILTAVEDDTFTITCEEKVKREGEKRPKMEQVPHTFTYEETAYTKYWMK